MDYSKFTFPPYEYREYPKWVGDVIVQDADEEAALLGSADEPVERAKRSYNRKEK